jgi:acyl-CoA thioesterase
VESGSRPGDGVAGAVQAMFAEDTASRSLGIELLEAGGGRGVARMRVTRQMVNGHDLAHGGYLFLLADTAFAFACNSHAPGHRGRRRGDHLRRQRPAR